MGHGRSCQEQSGGQSVEVISTPDISLVQQCLRSQRPILVTHMAAHRFASSDPDDVWATEPTGKDLLT